MATSEITGRLVTPPVPALVTNVLRRGLPTSVLLVMTVASASGIPDARSSADVVFGALSACLWALFTVLTLIRPAPVRRGRVGVGVAAALLAQGTMLALGILARDHRDGAALIVGDVLLLVGILFTLASVATLGRCFGVLPDARGLVTRGPYRLVRHPVYLGELIVALGFVVPTRQWGLAVVALAANAGAQLVRTRYEEATIRAEFPEYDAYAARTRRLLPGLL